MGDAEGETDGASESAVVGGCVAARHANTRVTITKIFYVSEQSSRANIVGCRL